MIRKPTEVELYQQRVADADRQMRQGIEKAAAAIREFGAAVTRAATAVRVIPESMARVMAGGKLPGSHRTTRLRKKRRKAIERMWCEAD